MLHLMTSSDESAEPSSPLGQELALKVAARRNALVGDWAAMRMALGDGAGPYVQALLEPGLVQPDPQPLVRRVMADLLARGVPASRREIDWQIARFTARARAETVRHALGRQN